ncbi:unnamed protein product [Eruca vesicaria subsp. sativa]|uniref:non-specific serine/threonine protein kinase n=1 Tax=Eruca vesicaria subsp. sativa TaxID=29727 RepID=A0ABC8LTK4_ERUVS|nr:unnamed protein product [Eruca vesicaria subsp. sativa]
MVLFLCFLLLNIFSTLGNADINTSSPLSIGQTLSSPNGVYELGFFSPNNTLNQYVGIRFKNITPQVVVWVANRDKPITKTAGNLTISSNGSLILLDGKQDVIWSTGEAFTSNKCHAELLDTGNLVVIDDVSGKTLWQSFENLGNTMLPQSSVSYDIPQGKNRVLTSWKSNNDPSPGDFSLEFTPQVPPQGLIRRGSEPYWRSGPWAKTKFSGIPGIDASYVSPFTVVQDVEKGTASFSYSQLRNYKLSYVTLTSEGKMKILWSDGKNWTLHFAAPVSSCDLYGACGPFGLCLRTSTPKCICMKGFVPKSDEEWRKGNWTSGCVRHTQLSCQVSSSTKTQDKDEDVFYHMNHVKTPDMYEFASFLDAEQCHQGCLGNCSCTAFAYISGIGCLVWNRELVDTVQFSSDGESLSLRLASSELVGSSRSTIIAGATASLSIFVILVFSAYMFWRYRAKKNVPNFMFINTSQDARKNDLEPQDVSGINFFEMHTIRTATNNFSSSNKLGQGGFGPVYKGKLVDGKEIAVKRLSSSSGQGTEEFMNEITLISKLQHRNLVRLLGCCIKGEEKLLIYEFLENKSLDVFLFDSTLKFEIDWAKRFDIIQGIARGLLYLHRDSRLRVIHRDLKVSNILLDERMIPKISDFGLARMFQGTHFQDNTRRVVGTLGYMSPEYAWTGVFSEKSDIYAFGVILLEIISGEKISRFNNGEEGNNLILYAWECWCETKGVDFLDQDLADSCVLIQVSRCVQIGLICVQHQPVERPNTVELLSMLTTKSDLPSPKQPIFALHSRDEESTSNDVITRKMGMVLFVSSFLLTIYTTCVYATINSSSPLSIGQTLSSPGGFYELGFFSPNNTGNQYVGIWFKKIVPRVVVWVANRDSPVTNSAANLTISSKGSLILLDENQQVIWSTGDASSTSNRSHAELLDNGNLVVIDDVSRKTIWESFENLGNTMLPQSTLMYDLSHGKKRALTSWKSYSDPSLGNFSLEITSQVPLQGLIKRGSVRYWRTGPWAKTRFTEHSCDIYGTCGPFGLCVRSSNPKCICVKGFVPKSVEEWKKGNWTSGCVRRTKLSCQMKSSNSQGKDTDIFFRMTNVKTPDLHQFASFLDADMCYQGCLGNCSCTAFAYISGIGCLVWNGKLIDTVQFMSNGETLSIRLASSEMAGRKRTKIIVATTACLSMFAVLVFTAFMFLKYRAKRKEPTPVVINTLQDVWKNDFEPQDISGVNFFEMHTIRTATDNFSSSNKLGQGGFGPVYKGKLLDGKEIAAKRLASSSDQGTGEFLNEIRLISKLQHRNLVRLLGYCIEGEEKLLIYEFMVNKSLDIFLFDSTLKLEIDWQKRFEIIQGIARGLLYLHRDSRLRVIHRDLKASNILLDEKMNPKISDFGLARMFQGTQYQDNTRRVVGTLGYMSPEYAWAGLFSEKSDIYSLGVLMLEIISGKKISRFSFGDGSKGLLAYAWESWCETGGADLLDPDLTDSCNIYEVARCVQIGLLCVQHEASDRPNTLQVLSMITSTTELPIPKQPIFAAQTLNDVFMSESESKHLFSVNQLTQSVIQGR